MIIKHQDRQEVVIRMVIRCGWPLLAVVCSRLHLYRMYEKIEYYSTNWWLPVGPWSPVLGSTVYTNPLITPLTLNKWLSRYGNNHTYLGVVHNFQLFSKRTKCTLSFSNPFPLDKAYYINAVHHNY